MGANRSRCCPTGVTCTGTVGIQTATTTTGTSTGITITTPAAAVVSVVSNSYFPFPVIPATYIDAAACLSAYSACQTNYAACTADLQGSSFGVTVVAPNGAGVTVAPTAQNLGSADAVAVCSSLSSEACGGIQSASCAVYGTATTAGGTFFVGGTSNPGCRQTMGAVAKVGMVAGVGLGIAGQLV